MAETDAVLRPYMLNKVRLLHIAGVPVTAALQVCSFCSPGSCYHLSLKCLDDAACWDVLASNIQQQQQQVEPYTLTAVTQQHSSAAYLPGLWF